jgi:hypothetical protein
MKARSSPPAFPNPTKQPISANAYIEPCLTSYISKRESILQSGILVEFDGLETRFYWLGDVLCGHKRWPKQARPCPRMSSPGSSQPVKDVGACGGNGSALSRASHNSADQVSVTHYCPHAGCVKHVLSSLFSNTGG